MNPSLIRLITISVFAVSIQSNAIAEAVDSPWVIGRSAAAATRLKVDPSPINRRAGSKESFAPMLRKVSPSVVNIFTTSRNINVSLF